MLTNLQAIFKSNPFEQMTKTFTLIYTHTHTPRGMVPWHKDGQTYTNVDYWHIKMFGGETEINAECVHKMSINIQTEPKNGYQRRKRQKEWKSVDDDDDSNSSTRSRSSTNNRTKRQSSSNERKSQGIAKENQYTSYESIQSTELIKTTMIYAMLAEIKIWPTRREEEKNGRKKNKKN